MNHFLAVNQLNREKKYYKDRGFYSRMDNISRYFDYVKLIEELNCELKNEKEFEHFIESNEFNLLNVRSKMSTRVINYCIDLELIDNSDELIAVIYRTLEMNERILKG